MEQHLESIDGDGDRYDMMISFKGRHRNGDFFQFIVDGGTSREFACWIWSGCCINKVSSKLQGHKHVPDAHLMCITCIFAEKNLGQNVLQLINGNVAANIKCHLKICRSKFVGMQSCATTVGSLLELSSYRIETRHAFLSACFAVHGKSFQYN